MQEYFLELALLCLCLLALGLWMKVASQTRGPIPRQYALPHSARRDRMAGPATYAPPRRAKPRPTPVTAAVELLPPPACQTAEEKLATAISALYAIARGSDNRAAMIAERTLPRLQDYKECQNARLGLAVHRLGVMALSQNMLTARIAAQSLSAIEGR